MIIETKVYSCRKCRSEELVKNGTNASGSSQIERTFRVSRRTLSAWLKEQANDLPPLEETLQPVECKKIPVWRWMSYGPLSFVAKTKFGSGLPWIERPEKSPPLPAVIAPKMPVGPSGIAHRLLIKKPIVFSDYWSAYQAVIPSEQQRLVGKETEETAHIERWNNTLR